MVRSRPDKGNESNDSFEMVNRGGGGCRFQGLNETTTMATSPIMGRDLQGASENTVLLATNLQMAFFANGQLLIS